MLNIMYVETIIQCDFFPSCFFMSVLVLNGCINVNIFLFFHSSID